MPADNPLDSTSESNETQTILDEIFKLFRETNFPSDGVLREELVNLEVSTLLRIKSFLISIKTLSDLHQLLQSEMSIVSGKGEDSNNINNMMDQLSENLKKLEETKVKELFTDALERYLSKNFPVPSNPSLETLKFLKIQELHEFMAPLELDGNISRSSVESSESDNAPEVTMLPNSEELQNFQILLTDKNNKINNLEDEVQAKIRELEALKSDLTRFQELDDEVHKLRVRNSEVETEFQSQKTEYSILTNENKLFQSRFHEISDELEKKNTEINSLKVELIEFPLLKEKLKEAQEMSTQLGGEIDKILLKLNTSSQKIAFLESNLQNFKEQSLQLLREKQELSGTIQLKDTRIQEVLADLKAKQQECVQLRESMDNNQGDQVQGTNIFSNQLEEKELIIADLKQELHELNEKVQHMVFKDEHNALVQKLEEKEHLIVKKNQNLQDKSEEIQQIKQDFKNEKDALISKLEQLQEKIGQHESLAEKLREKEDIIEDYQNQEEEFHEALLESVKSAAEKEELSETIKEMIIQKEVLFERISVLNRDSSGLKAIIDRLKKQIEGLESQAKETKALTTDQIKDNIEKEMLQKQVDTITTDLREQIVLASEANGRYQVIRDQLDQQKKELKDLQDNYDLMKQDNYNLGRKLQEQKGEYSEKMSDLEHILSLSERKTGQLETDLLKAQDGGQLQGEIDQLNQKLDEKSLSMQRLSDSLSKADSEMTLGKKEIGRLNEEVVNLKRRIKILRRDLSQQP
ncbi:MAG: hypothetical protein ACTSRK_05480 [Promethearchaeota archaeon]